MSRRMLFRGLNLAVAGFVATAAAAGLAGMAVAQPGAQNDTLLNSERIEQRFGSYGIEVLAAEGPLRVSDLYSRHDGQRVTRTFAVVHFAEALPAAAAEAHAQIIAGGSIGAVFASLGWTVSRRHLWFGELPASERVTAMMGTEEPAALATHLFELVVSRADEPSFSYATIAEVHHPAYLSLTALHDIFGALSAGDAQVNEEAIAIMLARVREAMR